MRILPPYIKTNNKSHRVLVCEVTEEGQQLHTADVDCIPEASQSQTHIRKSYIKSLASKKPTMNKKKRVIQKVMSDTADTTSAYKRSYNESAAMKPVSSASVKKKDCTTTYTSERTSKKNWQRSS